MEVTISNRTIARIILSVVGAFIGLLAIREASHAILLVAMSIFLALVLNSPVHWIASRTPGKMRGNRTVATAISYILVVVILGAFLANLVPPLARQTGQFFESVPRLVEDLRSEDSSLGQFVRQYKLEGQIDKLSEQLSERIDNIGGAAISTVSRIGSSFFSVITVLVLTFMMLIEGPHWVRFGLRLAPSKQRSHWRKLSRDMYAVIKGYVNGQVVLAAIAALFIMVPLLIMDVSYPAALMVIVFFCGLVPMIGHTIGAAILSIVALFQSPVAALVVLGYYILYQQIENYVVQPKVQSNSTNMSPLLVLVSVTVGVSFGGIIGGLVAIPVGGCIRVLVLDYLNRSNRLSPDEAIDEPLAAYKD